MTTGFIASPSPAFVGWNYAEQAWCVFSQSGTEIQEVLQASVIVKILSTPVVHRSLAFGCPISKRLTLYFCQPESNQTPSSVRTRANPDEDFLIGSRVLFEKGGRTWLL